METVTCRYSKCGKRFTKKTTRHAYCSQACRYSDWMRGHSGEQRSRLPGRTEAPNGRFCQHCAELGRRTPLRGANRVHCPECWSALNKMYPVEVSTVNHGRLKNR